MRFQFPINKLIFVFVSINFFNFLKTILEFISLQSPIFEEIFINYNTSEVNLVLKETYRESNTWYLYTNVITLFLLICFIIVLSLFLSNKAKHIQMLNLISAFYLILYLYNVSLNFDNLFLIPDIYSQNITYFSNLFIFIAILTTIIFFFSISNPFYLTENTKIEFSLLIWCILLSSIYLILSKDFISTIILLECIAFCSYILVGFERKNKFSTTSALQYLILASIPSGLFILGLILLYNNFGSFYPDYINLILTDLKFKAPLSNSTYNVSLIDQINTNLFPKIKEDMTYGWEVENFKEFFKRADYGFSFLHPQEFLEFNKATCHSIWKIWLNFDRAELSRQYCSDSVIAFNYRYIYPQFYDQYLTWQVFLKELEYIVYVWSVYYYKFHYTLDMDHGILAHLTLKDPNVKSTGPEQWIWYLYEIYSQKGYYDSKGYPHYGGLSKDAFFYIGEFEFLCKLTFLINGFEDIQDYYYRIKLPVENLSPIFSPKDLWPDEESSIIPPKFAIDNQVHMHLDSLFTSSRPCLGYSKGTQIRLIEDLKSSKLPSLADFNLNLYYDIMPLAFHNIIGSSKHFYEEMSFNSNSTSFLTIYIAIIFIIVNLSFKITAAPFHAWAPSVYGGSPLATLTFLSIFSKVTIIFFSLWLFINVFESLWNIWQFLFLIIAFLSIFISILGAFSEKIFKRFFVYSSMGHVGFMLLGITVFNIDGLKGTIDYLILYILSSFIIWFIILHLTKKTITIINLKGLSYNQPYLSFIFAMVLFSLSGIPPFGGFFVKYEIFYSLIHSSLFLFAYLLLLLTIISFFYYLRLIKIFYFENNKKFYKIKNINDIKLRLIAYGFFIIPFFILFADHSLSLIITNTLLKSLF